MILTRKLCMAFYIMGKFFFNPILQDLKLDILVLKTSRFWKEIMLRTKLFFTLKETKSLKPFVPLSAFAEKTDLKNFWWNHVCCVKRWLESVSQLTYYCLYKIIPKLFREHQIYSSTYMKIYFSINIHITCIYIIQILYYIYQC